MEPSRLSVSKTRSIVGGRKVSDERILELEKLSDEAIKLVLDEEENVEICPSTDSDSYN